MGDFIVDTKWHCFLCLRQIPIPSNPFNLDHDERHPPQPSASIPPIYSLQCFSRYLKMDMGKVFSTNGPISTDLLAKVERAKLKAELCEECASITERLSKLYIQLEKIEIEMAFYVKDIHGKLVVAETDQLRTSIQSDFSGKLEIVNALRNEAAKKCSEKTSIRIGPLVKVQTQTKRQLNNKRLKIQSRTQTNGFINTQINSPPPLDPEESPDVKTEFDVNLEPDPSPANSFSMEHFDDDNEYISSENSNCALTNYKSPANTDFNQQPGIVPVTPQSSVNPKTGKHKCKMCSREFSKVEYYRTHYRDVHLKIRYRCSVCSKEFTNKSNHRKHFKSEHLGIRFKCEVSAKTFAQKVELQSHFKSSRTDCGKKRASSYPTNRLG